MFKQLESARINTRVSLADALDAIPYNAEGLVPAIAQDSSSSQVLMLAWMNREAIERTLRDGYAWYYSRSRNAYWKKGETSGHVQRLVNLRLDCDGDALLLEVEQQGNACHTYRPHCFYLLVEGNEIRVTCDPG